MFHDRTATVSFKVKETHTWFLEDKIKVFEMDIEEKLRKIDQQIENIDTEIYILKEKRDELNQRCVLLNDCHFLINI